MLGYAGTIIVATINAGGPPTNVLFDYFIVLRVRADPEPQQAIINVHRHSAVAFVTRTDQYWPTRLN
jgi:hypothetical protein